MSAENTISDRIRTIRKQTGLTQVEFAVALEVSRGHLASIETGHSLPGRELLSKIHREFGVSLDWLTLGQGDIRSPAPVTEEEVLLLTAYRRMPADEAKAFLNFALARTRKDDA